AYLPHLFHPGVATVRAVARRRRREAAARRLRRRRHDRGARAAGPRRDREDAGRHHRRRRLACRRRPLRRQRRPAASRSAVEVLHLPGHSPGHLGVLHRDSGTAIVIDAVLERGLYTTDDEIISPPPYSSVPAYRQTVERLRALRPERLGTSHYAPVEGRSA